jgi:hypothetical protein
MALPQSKNCRISKALGRLRCHVLPLKWYQYADPTIRRWLDYGDHRVAPICQSVRGIRCGGGSMRFRDSSGATGKNGKGNCQMFCATDRREWSIPGAGGRSMTVPRAANRPAVPPINDLRCLCDRETRGAKISSTRNGPLSITRDTFRETLEATRPDRDRLRAAGRAPTAQHAAIKRF